MNDKLVRECAGLILRRLLYGDESKQTTLALNKLQATFMVECPEDYEKTIGEVMKELRKERKKR